MSGEGSVEIKGIDHFDEALDTHVIDGINGESNWWYNAYYSNGWPEPNVFRMDLHP